MAGFLSSSKPSAAASTDPNNQKRLDGALTKIIQSGASPQAKNAATNTSQGKSGGGNIFGKAFKKTLSAIDMPRAFAQSGIQQMTSLYLKSKDDGKLDGDERYKTGWNKWWDDSFKHIGFGETFERAIVAENKIDGKSEDAAYKLFGVANVNTKWAKRVIGFAGDLAVAKATMPVPSKGLKQAGGAKGISRDLYLSENVAAHALAQKIETQGLRSLTKGELAQANGVRAAEAVRLGKKAPIAVEGGTHYQVPFTGGKTVKVIPTTVSRYTPGGLLETSRFGARNVLRGTGISDLVAGSSAKLRRQVSFGTATESRNAFIAMDLKRAGANRIKVLGATAQGELNRIKAVAEADGVTSQQIYHALSLDAEEFAKLEPKLQAHATQAANLNELTRRMQNDIVGEVAGQPVEWVPKREGWQPTTVTDDMRELLGSSGTTAKPGFNPAGFELKAQIVEGGEFRGQKLYSASEYKKMYGEALTPRQQADHILAELGEKFGPNHIKQMFSDDYFESMQAHLREATYRTQFRYIEEGLAKHGIAVDRYRKVFDDKSVGQAKRAAKARGAIWQARYEMKNKQALARQTELDLDRASAEIKRLQDEQTSVAAAGVKGEADAAVKADAARGAEKAAKRTAGQQAKNVEAEAVRASGEAKGAGKRASQALLELDELTTEVGVGLDAAAQMVAMESQTLSATLGQWAVAKQEYARLKLGMRKAYETAGSKIQNEVDRVGQFTALEERIAHLENVIADGNASLVNRGLRPGIHEEIAALTQKSDLLHSGSIRKQQAIIQKFTDGSILEEFPERVQRMELAAGLGLLKVGDLTPAQIAEGLNNKSIKISGAMETAINKKAASISNAYKVQKDLTRNQLITLKAQTAAVEEAAREMIGGLAQKSTSLAAARRDLETLAAGVPDDPNVIAAMDVLNNLAIVNEKGYLVHPDGFDWAHGVGVNADGLDLRFTRSQIPETRTSTQTVDNFGGAAHVTMDPRTAQTYAEKNLPNGSLAERYEPKVAGIKIRANNPKVYGLNEFPSTEIGAQLPAGELSAMVTGTFRGPALRDLQNEMMEVALDRGAIHLDDFIGAAKSLDHDWYPKWAKRVEKDILDFPAASQRKIIVENLKGIEGFDDYAVRFHGDDYYQKPGLSEALADTVVMQPEFEHLRDIPLQQWQQATSHDDYLWNKFVYKFANEADADVRAKIGGAHNAVLAEEGHDAVLYTMNKGGQEGITWAAYGLHPSQYEVESGFAKSIWGADIETALKHLEAGEMVPRQGTTRMYKVGDGWTTDRALAEAQGQGIVYSDVEHVAALQPGPDGHSFMDAAMTQANEAEGNIGRAMVPNPNDPRIAEALELAQTKADDLADFENHLVTPYTQLLEDIKLTIANDIKTKTEIQIKGLGMKIDQLGGEVATVRAARDENAIRMISMRNEADAVLGPKKAALTTARDEELTHRINATKLYAQATKIKADAQARYDGALEQIAKQYNVDVAVVRNSTQAKQAFLAFEEAQATSHALQLGANAIKIEADMVRAGKKVLSAEKANLKYIKDPESITKIIQVQHDGFSNIGWSRMAPDNIVEALKDHAKSTQPEFVQKALRHYDSAINVWKGYALMSPGTHFRNMFGGIFNNALAEMPKRRYSQWMGMARPYKKALKSGLSHEEAMGAVLKRARTAEEREMASHFDEILKSGVLSDGQSSEVRRAANKGNLNPLSTGNVAMKVNFAAMEKVEHMLRGSLALDTMMNTGGSVDAMFDRVFKYHFDYSDLSHFESGTLRRLIPFYTWSRKNLPLQIESILTNPRPYVAFLSAKRNLEYGVEQEEVVPSWMKAQMTLIHTPFKMGGSDMYITPDLPFKDLDRNTSPRQIAAQLTPIIKTPLELSRNKPFFTDIPFKEGYTPMPKSYEKLGIGQALLAIGKAKRNSEGNIVASDKTLFAVEQSMPLFGRARRLLPSEEKYNQRMATSYLSFLFGVGARSNTAKDQEGELYRRAKLIEDQVKDLQALGTIPKKQAGAKKKTTSIIKSGG